MISQLIELLEKCEKAITKKISLKEIFPAEVLARHGEVSVLRSAGYIKPGSAVAWVNDEIYPFGWVIDARRSRGDYILAVKEIERIDGNAIVEAENILSLILRREAAERADEILKFKYWSGKEKDVDVPDWLDRWQKKCFLATCSLNDDELILVIGPPGSGKTTFIAEAAKKLSEEERVWVSSNTNIAVDNVIEKLERAIRIGHPSKLTKGVLKHSIEYEILSRISFDSYKDYAAKVSKAYKEISRIQNEIIKRGRVVVGATILKGMMSPVKNFEFDTVFIDEASNTCISTALLALEKARKAVIVGDPYQLPPVYEVHVSNASKFGAFNFLKNMYRNCLWLRKHYRCNKDIIAFSAKYIYGFLEIDDRCREIMLEECKTFSPEIGDPRKAVMFVDCDGKEKKVGKSKINEIEAEVVCSICDDLASNINEDRIGVITPYVKQKELIASILNDFDLNIEVSTVHSYQGREKDVIIYSITATKNLYFASEKRMFNVAITRARKKFIAVGNARVIANKNLLLSKYLEYAISKGGYIKVS